MILTQQSEHQSQFKMSRLTNRLFSVIYFTDGENILSKDSNSEGQNHISLPYAEVHSENGSPRRTAEEICKIQTGILFPIEWLHFLDCTVSQYNPNETVVNMHFWLPATNIIRSIKLEKNDFYWKPIKNLLKDPKITEIDKSVIQKLWKRL